MDATKIIDINKNNLPAEVSAAFAWNTRLVDSDYQPLIQAESRADGSVSAFITTDAKAILFFDDCKRNGKIGRIIDDEVTLTPLGEYVLVQAKAYIYIDDVLKGTAVAGQTFQIGNVGEMDQCIQMASGIARSRALTNAGYGVVSGVTIPAPGGPAPADNQPLPFETANLPAAPTFNGQPVQNNIPVQTAVPGAAPQMPSNVPNPNDPAVWAKNVFWAAKKNHMGSILATSPKDIKWVAESMSTDCEVRQAARILYPEACRMLGVAPKPLK